MNKLNAMVTEITYEMVNGEMTEILHTEEYGRLISTSLFNTPKTFIALQEENRYFQFIVMLDNVGNSKEKKFFARPTIATAMDMGLE